MILGDGLILLKFYFNVEYRKHFSEQGILFPDSFK